jgi:hypothetical protein
MVIDLVGQGSGVWANAEIAQQDNAIQPNKRLTWYFCLILSLNRNFVIIYALYPTTRIITIN